MKHVKLSFFYSFSKNKFPSKSIQKSVAFRRKKILERTLSLYPSSKSTSTIKKKKTSKTNLVRYRIFNQSSSFSSFSSTPPPLQCSLIRG